MLTMPLGITTRLSEPLLAGLDPARLSIVLIEPIAASLPDRRFLLLNDRYRVTCVRDSPDGSDRMGMQRPSTLPPQGPRFNRLPLRSANPVFPPLARSGAGLFLRILSR